MALMRVYCGLATAEAAPRVAGDAEWLAAAVVDDAGRLLDICYVSDDAVGYGELGALLAERSGGASSVAVATDSDEHDITLLLAAAGRSLAIADDEMVVDYAERFADDESPDEIASADAERHAVGLARALQAGALAAAGQPAPRELMALAPVLAAHAAMAASRHGSAIALREVLRELYPAALRAYPDPAEPIPLAILDALPEPSLLGVTNRGRDAAVANELAMMGIADSATITDAITALRVAAAETPRRTSIGKGPTSVVAETIRQAVAAVRACDAAVGALIGLLATSGTSTRAARRARLRPVSGPRAIEAARRSDDRYGIRTEPEWPDAARHESARHDAARASRRSRPVSSPPVVTGRAASVPASAPNPALSSPALWSSTMPTPPVPAPMASAPVSPGRSGRTPTQRSTRAARRDYETPIAAVPDYPAADYPVPAPDGRRPSWSDESASGYPSSGRAAHAASTDDESDRCDGGRHGQPDNVYGSAPVAYPAAGRPATPDNGYPVEPRYIGDPNDRTNPRDFGYAGQNGYAGGSYGAGSEGHGVAPNRYSPDAPAPNGSAPGIATYGTAAPTPGVPAPGSRDSWPLNPPGPDADLARTPSYRPSPSTFSYGEDLPALPPADADHRESGIPRQRGGRVAPPWQSDDFAPPTEPSVLQPADPPMLRLVTSGEDLDATTRRASRHRDTGSLPPVESFEGTPDDEPLIFAEMRSAWFAGPQSGPDPLPWSDAAADQGWSAAERAAHPMIDGETEVGLPKRVPKANLVPGSALPPMSDTGAQRPVRDPAAMAAHTTGYFRGSRRGEEVRGYAVGGRPGRESGDGWDFSRDGWETDREPEYPSAAYR